MIKNRGKIAFFLVISILAVVQVVSARRSKKVYKLDAIQIFGTQKVTEAQIHEKFDTAIRIWFEARSRGTKKDRAVAARLRKKLLADVKKFGGFAWINLTEVELSSKRSVYKFLLMFDVIEKKDMATRFPFRAAPTASIVDGSKLIEKWNRYSELGWRRVRSGEVSAERGDCPAFFCAEGVGSGHAEISSLESKMESGVPRSEKLLAQILREEKDPKRRAAALYLLSFLDDGPSVANYAADGLFDSDTKVREAATAIFSDIAVYHKNVPIPIHKVVRLLNSPYPEDRGRALALMLSLADNADYESFLITTVAQDILKLLRVRNEANHDMAHTVMTILSGEDFSDKDYDAWDNWLWKTRKERAAKAQKED